MALQYIKNPQTFDCEFCSSKKTPTGTLKEDRNCGWQKPGVCDKCGDVPFRATEADEKGSKFICPACGGVVRFGKSAEFVLGKYRTPGCPKSMLSEQASFLIQLIDWSERTGCLPTAKNLLDESLFFFDIRLFVLSERSIADEEMRPKEQ